jgi:hypothetical protein
MFYHQYCVNQCIDDELQLQRTTTNLQWYAVIIAICFVDSIQSIEALSHLTEYCVLLVELWQFRCSSDVELPHGDATTRRAVSTIGIGIGIVIIGIDRHQHIRSRCLHRERDWQWPAILWTCVSESEESRRRRSVCYRHQ